MKIKLILAFVIGIASVFGADSAEESRLSDTNKVLVDSLISQIKSIEFDKNSPEVGEAYLFFSGQNILNAHDVHYALWYNDGNCSVETLYALYLALQGFLSPDRQRFIPEDLNGGFTKDNLEFLKKIFEESV